MEASMASAAGKPIMTDEEYDELKAKLRNKNSRVVQQVGLLSPAVFATAVLPCFAGLCNCLCAAVVSLSDYHAFACLMLSFSNPQLLRACPCSGFQLLLCWLLAVGQIN